MNVKVNEPVNEHGDPDYYYGQLKPGYFECDMCDRKVPWLRNINDGLWAICYWCMNYHYSGEEE